MPAKHKTIIVFGLTVSSSWGNGHATLWRGLLRSLSELGYTTQFFERDVPWYADARDLWSGDGWDLVLYSDWDDAASRARAALDCADVAIVTSYCPDAVAASQLVTSRDDILRVFYDLDTPVTLDRLQRGESVEYIPSRGLQEFDLVLSFTGGHALTELKSRLGARHAVPLYGSVDLNAHRPVPVVDRYACDLSWLGTYAADRQSAMDRLLVGTAQQLPGKRFLIGGSLYPRDFNWTSNIYFIHHVPPAEHPAFYCSSKITLNVTRESMARYGYCPSGRLFEAAACGVPILSDRWEGLEEFFEAGREILVAESTEDAVSALALPQDELDAIGAAAHQRILETHTSKHRAMQMLEYFQ